MADTTVKADVELTSPVVGFGGFKYAQLGYYTMRFASDGKSYILSRNQDEYYWEQIQEEH